MTPFYGRRRHWTVDGRVVYERKPHRFSVSDLERVLRSLPIEEDDTNVERYKNVVLEAFDRYCRARSYEPSAANYGIPPYIEPYPWVRGEVGEQIREFASMILVSGGDQTKFRVTASL
jgi:hypothetical protein